MIKLYGVPGCKKIINTKELFEKQNIIYEFVNLKKAPLPESKLKTISKELGLDKLVNSKGPTFRKLGLKDKNLNDGALFRELLLEQGMITRPLIEKDGKFHVGYDEQKIMSFIKK